MHPYSAEIVRILQPVANGENAGPMKAYMKNRFEFLGIKSPERAELLRPVLSRNNLPAIEELWPIVHELWEMQEREYQYFAMELFSRFNKAANKSWIKYYEYMIVNKSWWDTVDFIATTLVGNYFRIYPENIMPVTGPWMQSGNMWLQRSCLLFQLKYKKQTDTGLLASFIQPLTASKEFFIAKAIGWALREYSKSDPGWVQDFVKNHQLQPLSRKEALIRLPA